MPNEFLLLGAIILIVFALMLFIVNKILYSSVLFFIAVAIISFNNYAAQNRIAKVYQKKIDIKVEEYKEQTVLGIFFPKEKRTVLLMEE